MPYFSANGNGIILTSRQSSTIIGNKDTIWEIYATEASENCLCAVGHQICAEGSGQIKWSMARSWMDTQLFLDEKIYAWAMQPKVRGLFRSYCVMFRNILQSIPVCEESVEESNNKSQWKSVICYLLKRFRNATEHIDRCP